MKKVLLTLALVAGSMGFACATEEAKKEECKCSPVAVETLTKELQAAVGTLATADYTIKVVEMCTPSEYCKVTLAHKTDKTEKTVMFDKNCKQVEACPKAK